MPFQISPDPYFPPPARVLAMPGPRLPASLPIRIACRLVRQMVAELICLLGERVSLRRDRRRFTCQVRQIAMYVCHVALGISMSDIGEALGRDRSTVSHACHVVEDRRDDLAFDDFISTVERLVTAIFSMPEVASHD